MFQNTPTIPRKGRLDVSPLTVGSLLAASAALLALPAGLPAVGVLVADVAAILGALLLTERVDAAESTATMTPDEAERWFTYYHGSVAGSKGADIFETAGRDLIDWLDLLLGYQKEKPGVPVRLVQGESREAH